VCHLLVPRTPSYLPPDKLLPKLSVQIPGLNFQSPVILRRPGRSDTQLSGPGHHILSISFILIKTCLREHQPLPLAHHKALQLSTITSSIKSTPTTLPHYYKTLISLYVSAHYFHLSQLLYFLVYYF